MKRSQLRFGLFLISCLSLALLGAASTNILPFGVLTGSPALAAPQAVEAHASASTAFPQLQTASDWHVVNSPNAGLAVNVLQGVSAAGSNDVWAVGDSDTTTAGGRTLAEHWDGHAWTLSTTPNAGSGPNNLAAVEAVSRNDVWAVGAAYHGSSQDTLIEHWNGTQWQIVPSPNGAPGGGNGLSGVAASSHRDVWAVGGYNPGGLPENSLILHWDGSTWQITSSPNAPGSNFDYLSGVAVRTRNDAFAVGVSINSQQVRHSLIEHWDGVQWELMDSPNPTGATSSLLHSVAYLGRNNAWAVGHFVMGGVYRTLIEHWDGHSWQVAPGIDEPGAAYNSLWSIVASRSDAVSNFAASGSSRASASGAANEAGDAWAVGSFSINPNPRAGEFEPPLAYAGSNTLILHYHDGQWERVTSPNVGTGSLLLGVTSAQRNLWAIGNSIDSSPGKTLIEYARAHPENALR